MASQISTACFVLLNIVKYNFILREEGIVTIVPIVLLQFVKVVFGLLLLYVVWLVSSLSSFV